MIFLIMLILWFASSWISGISAMQVMFLGVCVFAIPGIGVTTIDKVIKAVFFSVLTPIVHVSICQDIVKVGLWR